MESGGSSWLRQCLLSQLSVTGPGERAAGGRLPKGSSGTQEGEENTMLDTAIHSRSEKGAGVNRRGPEKRNSRQSNETGGVRLTSGLYCPSQLAPRVVAGRRSSLADRSEILG
jgi:hypothetical protein